ncbi:hypothetical protein GCM10023085_47420 [Actinomadura viridis]|uniref:Uncharacterized protein n=1 Tax=Actinomadura viridis TaxID=58110 RepID=A0A931GPL8_9ACTN|nr:hypothetical protein [Actinomadura viridis]MBG6090756.1 hypothetical protein [Actinomadura viridis]
MALSGRTRIAVAVAGAAGAAALGMGGAALADPGGGRTELQIVSGHRDAPAATSGSGWAASTPGKDCPGRDPDSKATVQAAESR